MERVLWKREYSVGIPSFDAHHQKLCELANQLLVAMRGGKGAAVLQELLRELIRYTQYHFAAEEQAMAAHDYPALTEHKMEHNRLTMQVLAFEKSFNAGDTSLAVDVLNFLMRWLTTHMLGSDKRYSRLLKSKGVN